MTQDGKIVADFITTGSMSAARITTGIISDALNKNSWNLDTGELSTTMGTIGRYEITPTYLIGYGTEGDNSTCVGMGGNQAFWAGSYTSNSAPFRVSYDGEVTATAAHITGEITMTSGTVNVSTNNRSSDVIQLNYGDYTARFSPYEFRAINTSTNKAMFMQAGGIWCADNYVDSDNFTGRAVLQSTGLGVLNSSGQNVIAIGGGANGTSPSVEINRASSWADGFFINDTNRSRMRLNMDGLVLWDSSGNVTAEYPAVAKAATFSTISPYSSRFSVDNGGYYKWGTTCFVNVEFTSSYSATNGPRMTNALPTPAMRSPLQCLDITNNAISSAESILCYINTSGYIYMNKVESGHTYIISGTYAL